METSNSPSIIGDETTNIQEGRVVLSEAQDLNNGVRGYVRIWRWKPELFRAKMHWFGGRVTYLKFGQRTPKRLAKVMPYWERARLVGIEVP